MKRSDMIQMIYDHLHDNHFGQYGEFYKMCESLLDRMEEEGMLPPSTNLSHISAIDNAWEPEDE